MPFLRGLGERLREVGHANPGKHIRLMFQDEARIGQKGRVCHRWFLRGKRPPGPADQRYTFANDLAVPGNITLERLPPRSPELNPVERLWLYLKERFLSHRLLEDYAAILDAACAVWQRLLGEPGRLKTLCSYPWIVECVSS